MRTSCEIRTPYLVPNCCSQCLLPCENETSQLGTLLALPKGVLISQVSLYLTLVVCVLQSQGAVHRTVIDVNTHQPRTGPVPKSQPPPTRRLPAELSPDEAPEVMRWLHTQGADVDDEDPR
jgi:hypothetical protein